VVWKEAEFDGTQALRYAERIAFPRKTGTDGHVKAAEKIIGQLHELGCKVEEENFSILLPPWVWFNGFPLISLIFLGGTWVAFKQNPLLAFILATVSVLWMMGWERFWIRFGRWIVSKNSSGGIHSKNILATFPGLEEKRPLYFVTHYDSKSQYLNLFARTGCLLLGSLSAGIFSFWVLIGVSRTWMGCAPVTLPTWIQGCFFLTVGLNVLFMFTRNGNDSDGAVDNASGVSVLLEVAKILRENPPKNIAPVFLFTDAEEFGLLGSLMFQRKHGTDMVKRQAWVVNVDSIGGRGQMRACAVGRKGKRWLAEVLGFAREKDFFLRRIPFLEGIMMDHLPFGRVGIPAISLTSVSGEGWHLHTHRDQFSLLDEKGLEEMGEFLLATVQWLETTKQK
jgi:hypothetical protein